jgi:hypothetical protein
MERLGLRRCLSFVRDRKTKGCAVVDDRLSAVTFPDLIACHYYALPAFNPDELSREEYSTRSQDIREAFQRRYGRLLVEYHCENMIAAVALTDQDRIHSLINEDLPTDVYNLLLDSDKVHDEVEQFLDLDKLSEDRRRCMEMLMNIKMQLLGLADRPADAENGNYVRDRLTTTRNEIEYVRRYFLGKVQRTAQIEYFRGMLFGASTLLVLAALFGPIMVLTNQTPTWAPVLSTFVAGGTGAFVSVLSRMTFGSLTLDYSVGWNQLSKLGFFRPVIGALFGLASYILVVGGLLSIASPPDPATSLYFYTGVAFLAGFSERWAQDMLSLPRRKDEGSQTTDTLSQVELPRDSAQDPPVTGRGGR